METIEGNKVTSETLSGVSLSSQPSDELRKILKPSSEKEALSDEVKGVDVAGGGGPVVVTKVVEKTEVTVRVIQENKDGKIENQEREEGFEKSVAEKNEGNESEFGNIVNSTVNGTSVAVNVKSPLAGENGSEVQGGERDENAGGDLMNAGLFGQNEENVGQSDESKRDSENDDEGNVENKEEYDGEQDEMEEDHDFVVGDFVWGKIKSHPWWPGQVYDPSDASDYATALKRKGRLLVAYFGDGSFSWCSPSQLKPFIDCFQEMSVQSDSKKFVNAVQKALGEVSMLVEAELMCKCHMLDWVGNVGRVNSGIKEGIPVPKGNTIKVLIDRMQPVEILLILKASATMEPGTRVFELEHPVLKSWLSAYYRYKGGYLMPEYHDPMCIEGLEDEERSGIGGDSDINGPSESADYGDDKLYQRRKQKSVAELLGEAVGVDDEPKIKKSKTTKDGGSGGKASSGAKRERKPKALVVSVTPESDHESGGLEEEMMSPRQRKKSKYLSPPYLSPIWQGKHSGSGSGSFKEPKTEPEKVPEMAAKQLEESFKSDSGRKSRQRRRAREGSDSLDSKDEQKIIIDAALNVTKVLHAVLTAALDPSLFAEKKNLSEITKFILSFRSSVFEEGSGRKKDPTMTLVIEFPPEASLPTKRDLSRTYKTFGDLIKKEIQRNESRVLVVFGNSSDAEAALVMSMEKKPFGEVEYYLTEEVLSQKEVADEETSESDVAFIKRRLETMGEMVKECEEDEMSAEVKSRLEEGIKEVLAKVCKMRNK